MHPRRWPIDNSTPSGRRNICVAALLLVLAVVVVAIVVVSGAAVTTGRPSGIALMAADRHQIDTETQKAALGCSWWRNCWQFSGSTRRKLIGSVPPTCRYKCGLCSPCRAVHVPIQPGWSSPMEYYPEAWRCQCGNKLFMP
ncbi:unnamed protein product [Victoria cruziana]